MNKRFRHIFSGLGISLILVFMSGCAPASADPASESAATLEASEPQLNNSKYTMDEAERLSGSDVKEPAYLPEGVFFDFATYQTLPHPNVTLHFKLIHPTYGEMGEFFQIFQEPQAGAPPNPTACGESGEDCETIQLDDLTVKYRLTSPTEFLLWELEGFRFQLLRTAGEPDRIYKDELLKIAASMH